jgi:hypothetical protein
MRAHIGTVGTAFGRLHIFAIIDDIDAAFDLLVDYPLHRPGELCLHLFLVFARLLKQLVEFCGPGQVAAMAAEDVVG